MAQTKEEHLGICSDVQCFLLAKSEQSLKTLI